MKSTLRRAVLTCAAGVLALSCFSERAAGPDEATTGARLCGPNPGPNVVQIRNYAFSPAELEVTAGTEVTWVNCDEDAHTSTADGGAWDSPLLSRGAAFSRTFAQVGRFAYHCRPHPFMVAAIVVR
jgi:plastocyanin